SQSNLTDQGRSDGAAIAPLMLVLRADQKSQSYLTDQGRSDLKSSQLANAGRRGIGQVSQKGSRVKVTVSQQVRLICDILLLAFPIRTFLGRRRRLDDRKGRSRYGRLDWFRPCRASRPPFPGRQGPRR